MAGLLYEKYSDLAADTKYKSTLKQKEFKVFSQNGDDGLILYILSQIGVEERNFVEFGFGDGIECNAANLILNFGWTGLMMDGNPMSVQSAQSYYSNKGIEEKDGLKIRECFITKENINQMLKDNGMEGEIGMLSIDIDGNDYWIWKEIDIINPRLLVIEYNASFGKNRSLTVKYDPAFNRYSKHKSGWYHGASLLALEKLGKEKNYSLVGCNTDGVNAFFVRNDLLKGELRVVSASEAYYPMKKRLAVCSVEDQFKKISHLPYSEI